MAQHAQVELCRFPDFRRPVRLSPTPRRYTEADRDTKYREKLIIASWERGHRLVRQVREIPFQRAETCRLKVDEHGAAFCPGDVAFMRLAVQLQPLRGISTEITDESFVNA